jgi:hypothetical protein
MAEQRGGTVRQGSQTQKRTELDTELNRYLLYINQSLEADEGEGVVGGNFAHKHVLWSKLFDKTPSGSVVRMLVGHKLIESKDEYYNLFIKSLKGALHRDIRINILLLNTEENGKNITDANLKLLNNFCRSTNSFSSMDVREGFGAVASFLESKRDIIGDVRTFEVFDEKMYRIERFLFNDLKSFCNFSDREYCDKLIGIFDKAFELT